MKKSLTGLKSDYNKVSVPDSALDAVKKGIERGEKEIEKTKVVDFRSLRNIAAGIAAVFALCIIGVNSSAGVASAMGSLPLLGRFFEVVTVRNYDSASVTANVPGITDGKTFGTSEVNAEVSAYIDRLIAAFERDYEGGFASLDVNYEVTVNNEKYFTLDVIATETGAGAYEFHKFYTIDKETDSVITLADLFKGKEYISPISEEILRQMDANPQAGYFACDQEEGFEGFREINEDQNFYIDEEGQVVIVFDEYEVGAGSEGSPRFVIPKEITDSIK